MTIETILIRIALATIIGGLIGWEREVNHRPAGFRTNTLVCIGSTIVMITGICLSNEYVDIMTADPARLSAQVISGIGFLGAGTIIKNGKSIRGLTTAASLWVVACIGLAIGAGFYNLSIISGTLIIIILTFFNYIEKRVAKNAPNKIRAEIKTNSLEGLNTVLRDFEEQNKCKVIKMSVLMQKDNDLPEEIACKFHIKLTKKSEKNEINDIYTILNSAEGVLNIKLKQMGYWTVC